MSAAVTLMLEGMPSPRDLHLHRAAGRVVVLAGSAVVAEYGETDLAMRNMAIVTLRGGVSRLAGRGGVRPDSDVCGPAEVRRVAAWRCGTGRPGRPGSAAGAGGG